MLAFSPHPAGASSLSGWNLLFARDTEPDLDFEEDLDDLEGGETPGGYTPRTPQKGSGRRPLVWILLLVLVGAGGYLYMEPGLVNDLLAPILGEPPPAQVVVQPPPKPPATVPPAPTAPKPAAAAVPSPQFMEGQQVSVILDPAAPGGSLALSADPAGTRPGPKLAPGASLTVLDGTLHNNSWVYNVKTAGGAQGWIAEARLVPKP